MNSKKWWFLIGLALALSFGSGVGNLLAAFATPWPGASPAARAQILSPAIWRLYADDPTLARRGMAAAFDAQRRVVVMFGGEHAGEVLNETWEFNGTAWQRVTPQHTPPARFWHGLAYDAARNVMVMFGGFNDQERFNDTWEYDGVDWHHVVTQHAPEPRFGFGMTYDSCRNRVLLFGGSEMGGTWEYDGEDWQEIATDASPDERNLTALVFDPQRCRAVLFGGGKYGVGKNDTWEYDGSTWVRIVTPQTPPARWAHAMAYDPVRQRVVMFGGYGEVYPQGTALQDTWEYNGATWVQQPLADAPSAREQHVMVYVDPLRRVVLFGGFEKGDTWFYGSSGFYVFLPIVTRKYTNARMSE